MDLNMNVYIEIVIEYIGYIEYTEYIEGTEYIACLNETRKCTSLTLYISLSLYETRAVSTLI